MPNHYVGIRVPVDVNVEKKVARSRDGVVNSGVTKPWGSVTVPAFKWCLKL